MQTSRGHGGLAGVSARVCLSQTSPAARSSCRHLLSLNASRASGLSPTTARETSSPSSPCLGECFWVCAGMCRVSSAFSGFRLGGAKPLSKTYFCCQSTLVQIPLFTMSDLLNVSWPSGHRAPNEALVPSRPHDLVGECRCGGTDLVAGPGSTIREPPDWPFPSPLSLFRLPSETRGMPYLLPSFSGA